MYKECLLCKAETKLTDVWETSYGTISDLRCLNGHLTQIFHKLNYCQVLLLNEDGDELYGLEYEPIPFTTNAPTSLIRLRNWGSYGQGPNLLDLEGTDVVREI